MGILARAGEEAQKVTDKLTTKLVYDWRLKTFVDENGVERKRSSSTHILNLLRLMYLHKCGERDAEIKADSMEVTLACLDVKDAFLRVPQDKPVKIKVGQEEFLVEAKLARPTHGSQELVLVFEGTSWRRNCSVSFALSSRA